ncbi:TadE/TadG family type IV pilus assembly protein [Sphingomonas sp.]|uniref:TadE/TadG family type IV pilus assembly protein n=1 Tax=Sphingomonas sp. TaxID=28214 RepID=UPI0028A75DF5|nr:TadE/TadG family type IV pilus assembly protein [Sphingomonas sp.]
MYKMFLERFQRHLSGMIPKGGLLGRLRRNVAGNTLAMMAIALIPLLFIAGSAIDTARLYMVKSRLQQACDAGALAGRRFMASTNDPTLDKVASDRATEFFNNNFKAGLFGTKGQPVFAPSKTSDNQVSGTASVVVPMTLTSMMGFGNQTLRVACEARYDVADTDIMFVLDTTGSMACTTADGTGGCGQLPYSYVRPDDSTAPGYGGTTAYAVQEKGGSKIAALRQAVIDFYKLVHVTVDPSTNVRYGFVTYTSTVNAGYAIKALSPDYIVNSATYDSRGAPYDVNNGASSYVDKPGYKKPDCDAVNSRTPITGFTTSGTASKTTGTWTANNQNSPVGTCRITTQPLRIGWTYKQFTFDTSQYKLGNTVIDPSKINGTTSRWQGCVEERSTTKPATFDVKNLPPDLDPDTAPTSDATKWRPMWPDVIYYRGNTSSATSAGNSTNPYGDYIPPNSPSYSVAAFTPMSFYYNIANGWVSCGKPVRRLTTMSEDDVRAYVNAKDFVPQGGTYHDTGMIWGTRLISPTGMFASDTRAWPGRNAPQRYIVFMTDGDMQPNMCLYGMYGIESYDQRVVSNGANSCAGNSKQLDAHNARFLVECEAAKARNITIFVVAFGQTLTTQLQSCASPGQAFYAADNAALNAAFQTIAKRVAMLRISR